MQPAKSHQAAAPMPRVKLPHCLVVDSDVCPTCHSTNARRSGGQRICAACFCYWELPCEKRKWAREHGLKSEQVLRGKRR